MTITPNILNQLDINTDLARKMLSGFIRDQNPKFASVLSRCFSQQKSSNNLNLNNNIYNNKINHTSISQDHAL